MAIDSKEDSFKPRSTSIITRYLYRMFGSEGLDVDQIFERAGIDLQSLNDPLARVPHEKLLKMWEVAGELSGDSCFGLNLAAKVPVVPFNAGDYVSMTSKNLRELLYNLSRYMKINSDAVKVNTQINEDVTYVFIDLSGSAKPNRHHTDFWLAYLVRYIKGLLGLTVPLAAVGFNHDQPKDVSAYKSVFNSALKFNQKNNYICYESKYLEASSICADLSMHRAHEAIAIKELHALDEGRILNKVKRAIFESLSEQTIEFEAVASALNLTPRTVQRQLANEGTTFKKLVDAAKKEHAISEIENTNFSIAEVAYRVGYRELSSFYRAFKRWTGKTPITYREDLDKDKS